MKKKKKEKEREREREREREKQHFVRGKTMYRMGKRFVNLQQEEGNKKNKK